MSRSSTSVDWYRTVWQVVHNVLGEHHCLPTYWAVRAVTQIVSLHRHDHIA